MINGLTDEEAQRWQDQQAQLDTLSRDLAARQVLQQRDEQIRIIQAQLQPPEPPARNIGEAMLRSVRDAARAAEAEKAKQPVQAGYDWNKMPDINRITLANRVKAALEG